MVESCLSFQVGVGSGINLWLLGLYGKHYSLSYPTGLNILLSYVPSAKDIFKDYSYSSYYHPFR